MPRVTIDLRDVRHNHIEDPRVLVRFVHNDSGSALAYDVAVTGTLGIIDAPLAPGSLYRVELTPSRFSPALRPLNTAKDDLALAATLIHRASEWAPAFTPWAMLAQPFQPLRDVLGESPRLRVGRVTTPVEFVGAEYDKVAEDDESRTLAKASLLNMYALLSGEPRPGTAAGNWFDGITELLLVTRERIIGRIEQSDAALIKRIKAGAHGSRYKSAPAVQHVKNFQEISGFTFDKNALFSVKTKDKFGNIQLTVAPGNLDGSATILLDADCDENGVAFAHLLDLPKHAVTGGTHPIEIHDILVQRNSARDLGYLLHPKLAPEAVFEANVETRIVEIRELSEPVVDIRDIAVIGDSVTWGQGLREEQKLHTLVRDAVANGSIPQTRSVAHSGAVIGVGITPASVTPPHGEVPRSRPTIREQAAQLASPETIDLLILNGGINDLDIRYILNPTTSVQELTDDTNRVCGIDMGILLEDICARVTKPTARVAVLSYYPVLSADSRAGRREEFLDLLGIARPSATESVSMHLAFWDRIIENCAVFDVVSRQATLAAIERVNAGAGAGRVRFAAPKFKPENAALASKPWLFGLTRLFGPEDPMKEVRRVACDIAETDIFRRLQCHRASAGHPNARGAAEYAAAVMGCLT
jgi:lysophospholipase L1-like esterase